MAAGSFFGLALHKGTSFPVGKVDFMDLYPLSIDISGIFVRIRRGTLRKYSSGNGYRYGENIQI